MRAYFFQAGEGCDKALCHDPGFQRTQADPFQAFHCIQLCKQAQQGIARPVRVKRDSSRQAVLPVPLLLFTVCGKVQPVGTHMDARQDDLTDTSRDQSPDLAQDLALRPAADTAARKGDDAVTAELVAAVLNLDIGTGMSGACQMHVLKRGRAGKVFPEGWLGSLFSGRLLQTVSFLEEIHEDLSDLRLFVVADHEIDGIIRLHPGRVCLHITADCNHDGLRILFFGPVKHLTAFPVRDVGHSACIDHVNVRLLLEGHFLKPLVPQDLAHDIEFIAVYFAAQIVKSDSLLQMFVSRFFH